MSLESFLTRITSAKGELASELAQSVAPNGARGISNGAVVAGASPVRAIFSGREVDNFSSWDFLGITGHPRIERAAGRGLLSCGVGRPEPRGLGGFAAHHAQCEERFASFYGAENTALFCQKSQGVLSVITTLCRQGDLVLAPIAADWAMADACAVADVEYEEFSGLEDLENRLRRMRNATRSIRRVVVGVEAVSPLTGEVSDIVKVFEIADRFDCLTLIDESFGFGVLGGRGAGSAELLPRHPSIVGRLVGLSGCSGIEVAALVGPRELRELLYRRSHYLRRECAPSPVAVYAALELIDLVETASVARARVMAHVARAAFGLRSQGWGVLGGEAVPVVSLQVESLKMAYRLQGALLEQGVVVDVLDLSRGRLRGGIVRAAFSAAHSDEAVGRFLSACEEVYRRVL